MNDVLTQGPNTTAPPHVDTGQAIRFLKLIDPRAAAFTFQTFKEKGSAESKVEPKVIHSRSFAEVCREHSAGAGVYLPINATNGRGRKSENIVRVRAVWQEDDDVYDGAFPLPPSIVVESSPAHFHRYWLIGDHWPADDLGRADFAVVMERMVATYQSDKNAKDISRVLRVPGFWHRKSAPFLVRIVEASGKRYTRAEIMAAFPPVLREPVKLVNHNSIINSKVCGDGWLRGLVRTVASAAQGHRNSVLFWASCRAGDAVRDGKADEAFVVDVLLEAATHAGLPQPEAKRTIQSGMRHK
jgi:hypothetical protein